MWGGHYYPHFAIEKTESQDDKEVSQGQRDWGWDVILGCLISK